MNNVSEREKILGRIREALRTAAPKPGHGSQGPLPRNGAPPASHAREWLPAAGGTRKEWLDLFTKTATELKAEVAVVEDRIQLSAALRQLRDTGAWKKVASHRGDMTNFAAAELGTPLVLTDSGYDVHELENCDAAITECDALVAQTGSVLVTARSAGGRALSVLPPHHIVLARTSQLIPDLPEAFALLKQKHGSSFPSFISLITGPSRTGDIERILVLGAHGPKRLTVLLLRDKEF